MLDLRDREWENFHIKDIVEIDSGKDIYENEREKGKTPYISSTSLNNGIVHYVSNTNFTKEAKCLSVNRNGSVGYTFYHPYEALFSNDCRKLRLKHSSKYVGIFIARQITAQRAKYNYGYKMGTGRLKRQFILLPVSESKKPDWQFMEDYIREREQLLIQSYINYAVTITISKYIDRVVPLSEKEWGKFNVVCLFKSQRGREGNMKSLPEGDIPLVSARKINNGLKAFVTVSDERIHSGHTITLNNDGDGGAGLAYYQPFTFALDTHVTLLRPKNQLSQLALLFVCVAIAKQREKYGHGHSISDTRLRKLQIMLPIMSDGSPDWAYMEQYAKGIVTQKLNEYLEYKGFISQ